MDHAVGTHEIMPRLKSIKTAIGTPVSGTDVADYPLYAVCLECGRAIRIGNYLAEWRHIEG